MGLTRIDGELFKKPVGIGTNLTISEEGNINTTGVVTASKFVGDATGLTGVGLGTDVNINTIGIITASKFYGDISEATGAAAGLGTALSQDLDSPLNKIYYTDTTLHINSNTTVDVPESSMAAYTQYSEVAVSDTVDFIVSEGDDFIPDILGIGTETRGTMTGNGGRVRADNFSDRSGAGAPTFQTGLQVTGVATATSIAATSQITVGDTFLKVNAVGLGETTTVGRNAGVSTATGTIIYNSTSGNVEVYTGTGWKSVNSSGNFIDATGGFITDITDSGKTYRVHTFNGSDDFKVNYAGGENTVEYLVIGGGGSGGGDIGGGGGAGGFRIGTGHTVGSGTYTVTVGAGGGPNPVSGLKGIDSSFDGIIATGGGGGMQFPETPTAVRDGGSGGGKRGPHGTVGTGIAGQGYPGGSSVSSVGAGGGGGAADGGDYGSPTFSGPGGDGLLSTITGTQLQYCGGGGGGGHPAGAITHGTGGGGGGGRGGYASNPAENGSANRGGGGGGQVTSNTYGGLGGSGVVIIRYPIETLELKATGGRVTYANGKTIHTFEGSGHFTVTNPTLTSVDYLVVAGGAGGGGNRGGGGGAGGYLTGTGAPVTTQSYAVTVGAGGGGQNRAVDAGNGGNSVFSTFTSIGGGRGGGNWNPPSDPARMAGAPGGSGGGAGSSTPLTGGSGTAGQGNNGGDSSITNTGGGGGGAGGAGSNSTGTSTAAPGGAGSSSSISGSSVTYAAGGAGYGTPDHSGGGGSASNNTGGGGDGGSGNTSGGSGGSGIVIISYPT